MLRNEWSEELLDTESDFPFTWLEFYPENFMRRGAKLQHTLNRLGQHWPLTAHSVHLSLGGLEPIDTEYLREVRDFLDSFEVPWGGDHIGITMTENEILHEIVPLQMTPDSAKRFAERVEKIQEGYGRTLLIENTCGYMQVPGSTLSEADFIATVLEQSSVGLLLDVNNLFVNAINQGYDAQAFLRSMPLERVGEIHVGGFTVDKSSGLLIDSHSACPCPAVWRLLLAALKRGGPKPIVLEWEHNYGSFAAIKEQFALLHALWQEAAQDSGSAS